MSPDAHSPNQANKGFNIKAFMAAIIIALILIIASIFFFVSSRGTKDIPKANQPHPNSWLQLPVWEPRDDC